MLTKRRIKKISYTLGCLLINRKIKNISHKVTSFFNLHFEKLGKLRISVGVASILKMFLCPHTTYLQPVLSIILDWYLSISKSAMVLLVIKCLEKSTRSSKQFKAVRLEAIPIRNQLKYLSKLLPEKCTFSKSLPQKMHF